MPRKKPGRHPLLYARDGFIMVITVIVVTAIISIIIIKTALGTLTELDAQIKTISGQQAKLYTEGCLQEALIKLKRNNLYAGETLNLGVGTCQVTISGADNDRTIAIAGQLNNFYHNLSINVTLSPFAITDWDN